MGCICEPLFNETNLYLQCLSLCLLFRLKVKVHFAYLYLNTSLVSWISQYHSVYNLTLLYLVQMNPYCHFGDFFPPLALCS